MIIRLNRFLAECGIASRRKSDLLIEEGRVSVNGNIVLEVGVKIETDTDKILVDGELVKPESKVYFLLNKPHGTVTTTKDERNRNTVVNLIKTKHNIFPVGRLDYNTTGVLFLTNDGEFTNYLTHPVNKVPRVYQVTLDKPLEIEHKEKLITNVYLDKRKSKFINLEYPSRTSFKIVNVTCEEGRNHFVKRMFALFGYDVKKLHRISYAGVGLGPMKPGEYREMSEKEISSLMKRLTKKPEADKKNEKKIIKASDDKKTNGKAGKKVQNNDRNSKKEKINSRRSSGKFRSKK